MKDFLIDLQNLIIKHWIKLIVVFLIIELIVNFNEVKKGFMDGWYSVEAAK
jgi:hypothetical protein